MRIVFVAFLMIMLAYAAEAEELVLVRDGKTNSTIILSDKPSRAAQFAAYELQYHIEKITGARVPIQNGDELANGVRILVGESPATQRLGYRSADFQNQEYLIGFRSNSIILIGRDKDDYGVVDYSDPATFPDHRENDWRGGTYDEQGTAYAVYNFLEKFCGVRWYLPTELGLTYMSRKTLRVNGSNVRRSPSMKYRWSTGMPIPEELYGDAISNAKPRPLPWREQSLWYHRLRLGGAPYLADHSFSDYYSRFYNRHRGWFAQGYQGKPPQMCYTNPGLVAQVVQDARDYFDGKSEGSGAIIGFPRSSYYPVVPMDAPDSWCKCSKCQAELAKGVSNYVFEFINQVAKELRKSHPDKLIAALAYSGYVNPPTEVKLESNVSIQLCLHVRDVADERTKAAMNRVLNSWAAESKVRPKFLWLYYCLPSLIPWSQGRHCFPGFYAHSVMDQMKTYRRLGVRGIYVEPSKLHRNYKSVLLDQPELYVTFKLADDPSLDGNKLIDEFFRLYYGAAEKPMKAMYELIEHTYSSRSSYPADMIEGDAEVQPEEIAWKYLGNEERMTRLSKLMHEAHLAAKSDIEKQRVSLFDNGVWQYMLAGRNAYLKRISDNRTTVETLPMEWDFCLDKNNLGLSEQWYTRSVDDSWSRIKINMSWTDQGYPYHGVAWYHTVLNLPENGLQGEKLWLLFEAVDGYADIFLDGKKIGEQKKDLTYMWQTPFDLELPQGLDWAESHHLFVRVEKDSHAAGIWKPVKVLK